MVTLTKVFRQKDESFVKMLNAMRFGQVDSHTVDEFKKLARAVEYTDGIGPTQLHVLPHLISLSAHFCVLDTLRGKKWTSRTKPS